MMRVAEAARRLGVMPRTLVNWEKLGLVHAVFRPASKGAHRRYTEADLDRIRTDAIARGLLPRQQAVSS